MQISNNYATKKCDYYIFIYTINKLLLVRHLKTNMPNLLLLSLTILFFLKNGLTILRR